MCTTSLNALGSASHLLIPPEIYSFQHLKMNMTSENVDGVEHNVSTTSPRGSKHVVLGPFLNGGTALSVGRGSLIQWNPDMPGDDSPSYAMTCGCPFNWKSRIGHCELIWEWLKGNRREFMAAVTVTLTLVCMKRRPRPAHQKG